MFQHKHTHEPCTSLVIQQQLTTTALSNKTVVLSEEMQGVWDLLPNCHNPNNNTTQPQHRSWVGHENDFAHPTTPPHNHIPIQKLNRSL